MEAANTRGKKEIKEKKKMRGRSKVSWWDCRGSNPIPILDVDTVLCGLAFVGDFDCGFVLVSADKSCDVVRSPLVKKWLNETHPPSETAQARLDQDALRVFTSPRGLCSGHWFMGVVWCS